VRRAIRKSRLQTEKPRYKRLCRQRIATLIDYSITALIMLISFQADGYSFP
jgi:hypothetical protein